MGSTFGGLNTALTSLYAQRRGLDISGQNIANVNTEGYTRQRVRLAAQTGAVPGIYTTSDQVGSGVSVTGVERGRDVYLEARSRAEHANSAYLTSQKATYDGIEGFLAEPSDTAFAARLHDMWDSWNDVANNWQDPSTRTALIERSNTVASTLNDAHTTLVNQFASNNTQMGAYVDQVNSLAKSIAETNHQIVIAQQSGVSSNELQDERDRKIMQLSELTGATAQATPNGAVNVYVGNTALVEGFNARSMSVGSTTLDNLMATGTKVALQWTDTNLPVAAGGTMGATLDAMNTIIPGILSDLDAVANALASAVNTAQTGPPAAYTINGTPGTNFFTSTSGGAITAGTIQVAITDPADVAFSSGNPSGTPPMVDHNVADGLVDFGNSGIATGPDAMYQAMIGRLGVAAQSVAQRSEIQDSVRDQVDTSRNAESGVNLDEEMTNLLTFQRGYEAASRVLTTIDSMLDQLINRTGMVGR
ncbi:flagellar hook-associated protein FlgK [Actinoplanes sp. KI2]|uniref:flagellar hook-associated protein FlgK n=1 Tax=Actinoplanes sp. KI2 TaxID=2983315 RepID=UPI0021D6017E|nr:flagellar hook-associated protein FlgK [Actinoplanes sp. KI2]MCU7730130.1 flagellar hook-associated protein FlgK [Actinoplanes sp. KI2]